MTSVSAMTITIAIKIAEIRIQLEFTNPSFIQIVKFIAQIGFHVNFSWYIFFVLQLISILGLRPTYRQVALQPISQSLISLHNISQWTRIFFYGWYLLLLSFFEWVLFCYFLFGTNFCLPLLICLVTLLCFIFDYVLFLSVFWEYYKVMDR